MDWERPFKNGRLFKKSADEASEFAESVINTVREPLIALDQDLRVVKVSSSFYEFFKVKPEETVGQLIYDLGNKQWDIPKLRKLLETILPEKRTFDDYEVEHNFATIGRRIMLLNAREIQRAFGKRRIILLAIEDITERKDLERGVVKARDADEAVRKELGTFSYSVSHDLRAPLRAVAGFSRILVEDYADKLDAEAQRLIKIIQESIRDMGVLIDDLLGFLRLGRKEMMTRPIDMRMVVEQVLEKLRPTFSGLRAQVKVGALPAGRGDPTLIQQVFVNLLSNAIKFTGPREDALIEVGGREEGEETVYHVRDNGVGFDMRYVDKLFGVFQRLHSRGEFEGTGIGLALVQRIIHRHGGRVWAEGKVGEGAIFYFSLPHKEVKNEMPWLPTA